LLASPAIAKKPLPADEAALRTVIERIYAPYIIPIPEAPEDGSYAPENPAGSAMDGYEPPYSPSLASQIARWAELMRQAEEVYLLNNFDWFCQCQDSDNQTARLVSQSYKQVGKDSIDATVKFSPGRYEGKDTGSPLLFRFKRTAGVWQLDDLKFDDFTTLRKGLADDIRDAARDLAEKKDN
jgi:hypothetical protein